AVSGTTKRRMDSLRRKSAISTSAGKNTATMYLQRKAAKNAAAQLSQLIVDFFSHATANRHMPSVKKPSAPASRVAIRDAQVPGAKIPRAEINNGQRPDPFVVEQVVVMHQRAAHLGPMTGLSGLSAV